MITIVQPLFSKMRIDYIWPQDHDLYALDSTTISCSINLMGWALDKYSNVMKLLEVVPNAIYMMDKAYINFETLARIDAEGAFFVT